MKSFSPDKTLLAALEPNFKEAGFRLRRSSGEFRKSLGGGDVVALGVDLLTASKPGFFKAAVTGHIRVESLESVYAEYHPLLSVRERNRHYTVDINCDNIFRDQSVSQSFELQTNAQVVDLAERLWKSIKTDALPFLSKYSDRAELVENLLSDDYGAWITSDRLTRYSVLLSDRALAGDNHGFEKLAAEFLAYCKKPYGQMYLTAAESIVRGARARYFQG